MKNLVQDILSKSEGNGVYLVQSLNAELGKRHYSKTEIEEMVAASNKVELKNIPSQFVILDEDKGIWASDLISQIHYLTSDVEGFKEVYSNNKPNYNLFIKIDKVNKMIEFKLGNKHKRLKLAERGFDSYVFKPQGDTLICVDVDHLEEFIHDPFWVNDVLEIGRGILDVPTSFSQYLRKFSAREMENIQQTSQPIYKEQVYIVKFDISSEISITVDVIRDNKPKLSRNEIRRLAVQQVREDLSIDVRDKDYEIEIFQLIPQEEGAK